MASLAFIFDIFFTGLIDANYLFYIGEKKEFLNHKLIYFVLIGFQLVEMLLNFVTVKVIGIEEIRDPEKILKDYLKGQFLLDLITMQHYSLLMPKLTFIRLLRMLNMKTYIKHLDEVIIDYTFHYLSTQGQKQIVDFFDLLFLISTITHNFACFWMSIGM